MGTIAFTTAPINNGAQYALTDLSTGYDEPTKRVVVTAYDGTTILNDVLVPFSQQVIIVDTAGWGAHLGQVQILISLGINGDTLNRGYALPTTLNLTL